MAASANIIAEQAQPRAISVRWIISAGDDLIWFIGSVVTSYALLVLYVTGLVPLIPMVAAWAILIDAPHVFGTFSRTYFDKTERKNRAKLLWGSLLFFVVGPVMVLAGAGLVFFFVAAMWAYYHLVKQHYGFMVLYKKKNNDLAPVDNALDRLLLLFAFNYPFVAFIARDPEAMIRVPQILHSSVNGLALVLLAGTIILGVAWLGRQIQRVITGQALNVPKYLLLAAAIPMHWVVLLTPMPNKPIAIVAILTIYHNFQYHRLIWFHNKKYQRGTGVPPVKVDQLSSRNHRQDADATDARATHRQDADATDARATHRQDTDATDARATHRQDADATDARATHRQDADATATYGAASFISSRLILYIAFGIIFGVIYQGPRQYLGYVSLTHGGGSGTAIQTLTMQLGIAFLWGYAFIHYYLDSKIWRVRRDPSVGKALNM